MRFAFVDSLRGLAALGIACYHIHRYGPLREPAETILPDALENMVRHGWIGVQVFLVIAGFVAAYTLRNVTVTPAFVGTFTLRRVIRVGVPYWVVIIVVTALNYVVVNVFQDLSLSGPVSWSQFFAHLAFLQDILGYDSISAGLWFVSIYLQWSVAFLFLLGVTQRLSRKKQSREGVNKPFPIVLFLLPVLLALFVFNLESSLDMWITYFFHIPVFGALAWWTVEGRVPPLLFWLCAATLVVGLVVSFRTEVLVTTITGSALYLAGRFNGLHAWLSLSPLHYLGRISYSLFLIHYPASWLVIQLGYRLTGVHPPLAVLWLALALAASIATAHLFYVLVERPASLAAQRLKPYPSGTASPRAPLC